MIFFRRGAKLVEMPEGALAMLAEAAPDGLELIPDEVTVVSGTKMGQPARGLRLVAGGIAFVALMPEPLAREIGRQLGDGGVHRP